MEIIVPSVGESVVEALIGKWLKKSGDRIVKDENLCELETDKITFALQADASGILTQLVPEGETVKIGTVIGTIKEGAVEAPSPAAQPVQAEGQPHSSPSARKLAAEKGIDISTLSGSGNRGVVTAEDVGKTGLGAQGSGPGKAISVEKVTSVRSEEPPPYNAAQPQVLLTPSPEPRAANARERRIPMTPIRKRIAERLLAARQQTAMLTTFNEVDMSRVVEIRARHKEQMKERHGVALGFMSFFVKSCCEALREFPAVNARIDGSDIVYHDYYDIGIAIGGEKGLVVPVLRGADRLHFWEIEKGIADFGQKIKENRLAIADLEGGTFTISNGGVYGSMLSTPIINPPQSGVLGMHAIQDRAVVRNGEIVIRPMMYLALSYDHRIIDGKEAVQFLKRVKELVEEPEELMLEG
ncbi:MAG: 2-oxoglutarate dehydrogenase complex dihydrolipoyllysine-residue succinyltransferase [Geobacteraceae bacterium]|nr:2-oxoglutarate dehydrogenase complex dihydrolipoyllysine-residue succinyltransferase [Geobacteraceae bacterium]